MYNSANTLLDRPRLIASIGAENPDAMIGQAQRALTAGADMVELRLDLLTSGAAEMPSAIGALPPDRWIATCRSVDEGGSSTASANERAGLLARMLEAGRGSVDIEYHCWRESGEIRSRIRSALTGSKNSSPDTNANRLILSHHYQSDGPTDLRHLAREIESAASDAVIKLVWRARSVVGSFEALELMREARRPMMAICLGRAGVLTRVLAGKFGAWGTYCAADHGRVTAPGQLGLSQMLDRYRWRTINAETKWYGLVGDPVWHSPGPAVFNTLFAECGTNSVYMPIELPAGADELTSFLDAVDARRWLDFAGASVTVPHKEHARIWLHDSVDSTARRVGATNTLIRTGETWFGHNTDYDGFLDALTGTLECTRAELAGRNADVLGAGGVARAVVAALVNCEVEVTVCNRTNDRAAASADEFGCRWMPWAERDGSDADLLVNATTLGSPTALDDAPISHDRLTNKPVVVDMVYSATPTPLLAAAEAAGCRIVDGLEIYAHQAASQFRRWTGITKSPSLIRRIAETFMENAEPEPLK